MVKSVQWTPELVAGFWHAVSDSPLGAQSFARQNGDTLLELISEFLPPNASVLDFGAGDGDLIGLMLQRGYRVAAFEPSPGRRDKLVSQFASDPQFLGVVDANLNRQFDVLIAAEVVEHILDEQVCTTLEMMGHLLKPSGLAIITTPNRENLDASSCVCPACHGYFHRWQHVRSFDKDSLANFMEGAGMRARHVWAVDFTANRAMIQTIRRLEIEREYRRLLGWFYFEGLMKPWLERRYSHWFNDPEIGAAQTLLYVGVRNDTPAN